jgi:hypothetical protein
MTTEARRLYQTAFEQPRDPRSEEYRRGVRDALAFRLEGRRIQTPYKVGTCQFDAWRAGIDEGHALWRQARAAKTSGPRQHADPAAATGGLR